MPILLPDSSLEISRALSGVLYHSLGALRVSENWMTSLWSEVASFLLPLHLDLFKYELPIGLRKGEQPYFEPTSRFPRWLSPSP